MVARTVLHGIDEACPSSKLGTLLERANHGAKIWDETKGCLLVFDGNHLVPFRADGMTYWSTSSPRLVSDHFQASVINTNWTLNKGTDPQCVNFAMVSGDQGYIRGTTGDAGTGTAADAVEITGPVNFKPSDGEITFAARVKLSAITNVACFIGLHDTAASTLEMPFTLSGTTYTSTATDGVGFLFDTAATTDTIRCVGVANDVDVTHVDSADAWAADTYKNFRLIVSTAGACRFFIDDVLIATIAACCTASVNLAPCVAAVTRTTATRNCGTVKPITRVWLIGGSQGPRESLREAPVFLKAHHGQNQH